MLTSTQCQRLLLAGVLALACALAPARAQTGAADPAAAVPETRYQPAHVAPVPSAPAATPDCTWRENNRIVAGQPGHDAHDAHAAHKPAAVPADDPHAHHQGHHAPPANKEHH